MKKFNKILSLLVALVMIVTMLPGTALAIVGSENQQTPGTSVVSGTPAQDRVLSNGGVTATKVENPGYDLTVNGAQAEKLESTVEYADNEMVDIIVVMDDKPLLKYGYSVGEISANSASVSRRVATLREKQDDLVSRINRVVSSGASTFGIQGRAPEVTVQYYYNVILSGLAIKVPYGALEEIKSLSGVQDAFVAPVFSVPEDMSSADTEVQPSMYATKDSFGSALTWEELGYTGAGMRVAILDTGLDTDHPSFADDPVLTEDSLTLAEIESVLPELNAAQWYEYDHGTPLTAEDVYRSAKIPFAYNYGFNNLNVDHNDLANDHGTHVAGIAAANKVEGSDVVGVAPDAQVIVLKVFNENGGASSIDIVAAMEDAFRLNVDVMNLSLGSDAGFTQMNDLFNTILDSDMIVSISAGNSYSAAYGNWYGTNTNMTSDPDNGLVGWPGTMIGATTVASLENNYVMADYLAMADGTVIFYQDSIEGLYAAAGYPDYYGAAYMKMLVDNGEMEYVIIDGLGEAENFYDSEGNSLVDGKIAVVKRGTLSFADKIRNAETAGAVGVIIWNTNDTDDIFSFGMTTAYADGSFPSIPSCIILQSAGQMLADADVKTISVGLDKAPNVSSTAGLMSDFSSWGAAPDLRLVPSVTAPGGNIYSSVDPAVSGAGSYYATMSGTSMSAPHIAGMSALVLQYLRDKYDLTDAEAHTIAEALIMSTAVPVLETSGVPYSPRKQGAGSANVHSAIASSGYLTVAGNPGKQPSVSIGDDADKAGVYTFEFTINNLSEVPQSYVLDAEVLTDYVDTSMAAYGYLFMGETSLPLSSSVAFSVVDDSDVIRCDADGNKSLDVDDVKYLLDYVNGISDKSVDNESVYDLNRNGLLDTNDVHCLLNLLAELPTDAVEDLVVVPANDSVTVQVEITLSDDDKAYMDYFYPNGIYVDGFVRCYSVNEDADLSLPFLAFYGEWSEAGNAFDTGWWYELYAGDGYSEYNRYPNMFWTNYGSSDYLLGLNPYIDEVYDPAHNVLSPNGDGYFDLVNEIYFGMMRNAMYLDFNWVDGEGNVLFNRTAENVRKSVYNYTYGICYPFVYSDYIYQVDEDGYPILDANGYTTADIYDLADLENNTELTLTVDAYLDDGDLVADQTLTFPMVIDVEAPELLGAELIYTEETDTRILRLSVSDNYDIAALMPLTMVGVPYEYFSVDAKVDGVEGEATIIDLDVSNYDSTFYIVLGDYGGNESWYEIEFEGENNIDFGKFYGYRRYSALPHPNYPGYYYVTSGYNGWVSFTESDAMLNHTYTYGDDGSELEATVAAAEYIDGYIFGVDVNGEIFAMKSGDWTRVSLGTMPEGRDANYDYVPYPALDMTYDYVSGTLYILTDELVAGDGGHLMTLDYFTGEVTDLGIVTTVEGSQPLTLACDNDGILYTIDLMSGDLYTINPANTETIEPENWWEDPVTYIRAEYVGATGYAPAYVQSMTVDHETNELYWMAYSGAVEGYSYLFRVNKTTGQLSVMVPSSYDGTDFPVEYNCEMVALIKPYDSGVDLIPDAELESLVISNDHLVLGVGNAAGLVVTPYPYNADAGELTWTSSDEDVAVVVDGMVYAVGEGQAVITVSNGVQSVECVVDVVNLTSDLTVFDSGNYYLWESFNVAAPGAAEYLPDATVPYNGVYAAAYFDGYVYASESNGGFYRLNAETMQGVQIGSTGSPLLALGFNYTDGFMYGVEMEQISMWQSYFHVVRVNLGTGELERVAQFGEDYTPLGFMAIDYEGNFYSICGNTWTYGIELVKWTVTDEGMTVLKSWDISETAYNVNNYTSMTYSAQDNGLFFTDGVGMLYWIDADSLTDESEAPRIVSLGYVGEPTGYAMNMGMFTVPNPEPALPDIEITSVYVPENYLLLEGGSVSAGVTTEPWNAYPEITYTVADESIATVDSEGNIAGVSAGQTTLTITIAGEEYTAPITVCASTGRLNGYLMDDFMYGGYLWVDFSDTDPSNDYQGLAEEYSLNVFSGAYFDGKLYVYGQDQYNDYKNYFGIVDAETFELTIVAKVHYTLRDMAFDYTTGNLYAIAEGGSVEGAVAQVNTETGEVIIVADTGKSFAAMTIDGNGQMYGISEDDNLYAIDKDTGALTLVGYTGADAGALFQSMHYDLDTGNTYWAQVSDNATSTSLRLVDLTTGSSTKLGTITPSGAEISALYTVPANEPTEPDEDTVEVTDIKLPESATVVVGSTVELTATVLAAVELKPSDVQIASVQTPSPFVPVENVTVTWTSADENIATVDANGVVTGVAAGTVEITASVGDVSATCVVTVTETERLFYAYDKTNTQWISFSGEDPSVVTTVRDDAEGETVIKASAYTGEVIYSYDVDGKFYSIDPVTFERTYVGAGISEMVHSVESYDPYWDEYNSFDCTVSLNAMAYDSVTGKLYVALLAANEDYWYETSLIGEVNVATGEVEIVYESSEMLPTNLLVENGRAYFVDGFMSGILTYLDIYADGAAPAQAALIQGYWGDAAASSSLIKDELTGVVYAFRDFTDTYGSYNDDYTEFYPWDGVTGEATLCILNLADADIVELGLVGEGLLLNSLFIR